MEITTKKVAVITIGVVLGLAVLFSFLMIDNNGVNAEITKDYNTTANNVSDFIKVDLNPTYGAITIKNGTTKAVEYSLISNTENCKDSCEAIGKVSIYTDGILFDDVRFDTKTGTTSIKGYNFYISTKTEDYIEYEPVYEPSCSIVTDDRGTHDECTDILIDKKEVTKTRDVWTLYSGEKLVAGDYKWKLNGSINNVPVDWVCTARGMDLTEWAGWNPTLLVSVLRTSHTSNQAATNYSGVKILTGSIPMNISYFNFNPLSSADTGYILNGVSKVILAQATLVNGKADVGGYVLSANTSYYLVSRKNAYGSYTQYYTVSAPGFPVYATDFNYTTTADGTGADWTGGYINFFNVSYYVQNASTPDVMAGKMYTSTGVVINGGVVNVYSQSKALVGNTTTNSTGDWTLSVPEGSIINYTVVGYNPANVSQGGNAYPYITK